MGTLDTVPGAGLLIGEGDTVVDANERCEVVFKCDVDRIRSHSLGALADRGLLDERSLRAWRGAVESVREGLGPRTERVHVVPGGDEERYPYDLRATADADAVQCSLRSAGTRRRYDEAITALHAATREFVTADDAEEVLRRTAVAASDTLGFPGTAVRKYDPEEEVLRHVTFGQRVTDIDDRPPYPVADSPHGRAFRRGETVVEDVGDDDPYDREVFSQTMYIPVGEVGLLSVGAVGRRFDETDVQSAEILADNAAAAIQTVETTASLREERQRLELLKGVFSRVLRHNIRNDLNVITACARAIGRGDDPAEHVDTILEYADRVVDLGEQARRVESVVDSPPERRRLDPATVVERAAGRVEQARHVTVETDLSASPPVRAHQSLSVAVQSLFEAACRYDDDPAPTVTAATDADADRLRLTVAGGDPGLPEAEVAALRAGRETDLQHCSGLELWLAKWVVDRSEGTLEFRTDAPGTRVVVDLDRADRE